MSGECREARGHLCSWRRLRGLGIRFGSLQISGSNKRGVLRSCTPKTAKHPDLSKDMELDAEDEDMEACAA